MPWFAVTVTCRVAVSPASIHPFCVNVTTPPDCEHVHEPEAGVVMAQDP